MADQSRIEDLRRRIQSDPASIAFAALADEYRRAGRLDEAIAVCASGLKRHPAYLSAHVTLGRALLESGRLEEARSTLEFVLRAAPENLSAIQALALVNRRLQGVRVTGGERAAAGQPAAPAQLDAPVFIQPSPALLPEVQALESFLTAVRKAR